MRDGTDQKFEQKDKSSSLEESELRLRHQAQELGKLGMLLGARENAALYIAGLVLIAAISLLGLVIIVDENLRPDVVTTVSAVAIAAMGFIGGLKMK